MTDVAARLTVVRERIAEAAERASRSPDEVTLVAVTKGFPADVVVAALDAGARDIGENRAQELKEKAMVVPRDARWHFIGHLQTNKARQVVGLATLIHSVDRYGLAEEVARRARALRRVQDVLIEVNISGEATKHGVEPAGALDLAERVASLDGIRVRGLMAMAPMADEAEPSRPYFVDLRGLRDRLTSVLPDATELSMGMTRDYTVAVEEGATLVRVGEAIFGPRSPR